MRKHCPFPGCKRPIPRKMFACAMHWHALPGLLKSRIYAAARRVWTRPCKENVEQLVAVHDEAVAFWKNHEDTKTQSLSGNLQPFVPSCLCGEKESGVPA